MSFIEKRFRYYNMLYILFQIIVKKRKYNREKQKYSKKKMFDE